MLLNAGPLVWLLVRASTMSVSNTPTKGALAPTASSVKGTSTDNGDDAPTSSIADARVVSPPRRSVGARLAKDWKFVAWAPVKLTVKPEPFSGSPLITICAVASLREPKLAVTGSMPVTPDGCSVTFTRLPAVAPNMSLTVFGCGGPEWSLTMVTLVDAFRNKVLPLTAAPSNPTATGKAVPVCARAATLKLVNCTKVASSAESSGSSATPNVMFRVTEPCDVPGVENATLSVAAAAFRLNVGALL